MSGDLKKSLCTIGEGGKNKEGGREREGRGREREREGEEDVIMTFNNVRMWCFFFNATLYPESTVSV